MCLYALPTFFYLLFTKLQVYFLREFFNELDNTMIYTTKLFLGIFFFLLFILSKNCCGFFIKKIARKGVASLLDS